MIMTLDSLRLHPQLRELFKEAESRHLKPEELAHYRRVVPEFSNRADAAEEIREVDGPIVKKIIRAIYDRYPYEQRHQLAMAKCVRDVRYVNAYGTLAMLMGDEGWFRDKLLIWLKTILQAFRFPDLNPGKAYLHVDDPMAMAQVEALQPFQRSIFETYYGIKKEMERALSRLTYEEAEPFLQLPIDILAND